MSITTHTCEVNYQLLGTEGEVLSTSSAYGLYDPETQTADVAIGYLPTIDAENMGNLYLTLTVTTTTYMQATLVQKTTDFEAERQYLKFTLQDEITAP
jgi:hypothetical protein